MKKVEVSVQCKNVQSTHKSTIQWFLVSRDYVTKWKRIFRMKERVYLFFAKHCVHKKGPPSTLGSTKFPLRVGWHVLNYTFLIFLHSLEYYSINSSLYFGFYHPTAVSRRYARRALEAPFDASVVIWIAKTQKRVNPKCYFFVSNFKK